MYLKAAASGGVTTVCDMPLNAIPPTTTVENFDIKQAAAAGKCRVDVAFWGGIVPENEVGGITFDYKVVRVSRML